MTYLTLIGGLLILLVGGDLLVRHASKLAVSAGISPLVVGLTVVAYGTSSPELVTSVYAQMSGESALVLGNIVGSNIFNGLAILGICAMAAPLAVDSKLLKLEIPLMVLLSCAVGGFAWSGTVGSVEAVILLATLVAYTAVIVRQSRRESAQVREEYAEAPNLQADSDGSWLASAGLMVVGLGLLVFGGRTLVQGAVALATQFGLSQAVIGLTVVAAGTSFPELVASLLAVWRGERDIAVGNVVGSNLFNLMGVLGLSGLFNLGGLAVPDGLLTFDIPIMVAAALVALPVLFSGRRIDRWEGAILALYYVGYVTYLVLTATGNGAAQSFGRAMVGFAVPLTLLTIGVIAYREWGAARA